MTGMNSGNNAVATITVWVAVGGLSYLFNSFGVLSGVGATLMVFAAFLLTAVWNLD